MSRKIVLGIFVTLVALGIVVIFAFGEVNSSLSSSFLTESLDFSVGYGVKLDIDYLRANLEPAHE